MDPAEERIERNRKALDGPPKGSSPFADAGEAPPYVGALPEELRYPAQLKSAKMTAASNGLTYDVEFEAPPLMATRIAQQGEALTLHWEAEGAEKRLIGMGAIFVSGSLKRDPDGAVRLVVKYRLPQDQVLTGIGVVAGALALDATMGRLHVRSDQLSFDLAAKA
jgi:hypothetical protein